MEELVRVLLGDIISYKRSILCNTSGRALVYVVLYSLFCRDEIAGRLWV